MASIGKFVLSAASGAQETTLALANLNVDFSVIKLAAPAEFGGLGASLSKKRKTEAEDGLIHMTARKLGALFADDLPSTPNLVTAYGLRVSEIAENPKLNPSGSDADGALVSHVGADGTSIWAAATSGKGAVEVHLLACMLARIWPAPEAISIWDELITARKELLQKRVQEPEFAITMLTASRIEVARDNLAEWDASARSWLRTADTAKRREQTQLMLIIKNIGSLTYGANVYDNVIKVWFKALTTVDRLVSGTAQNIQSSDVLLGLSAWHLYPDMCILGKETTHVRQGDHLVHQGGLMTFGIGRAHSDESTEVSWSMPLAHLRYYGKPVLSEGSISSESSRIPFDRLVLVAIGSLISTWGLQTTEFDDAARFLILLWKCLEPEMELKDFSTIQWLELLSRHASGFLASSGPDRVDSSRLIALGCRRFGSFFAKTTEQPKPFFGISDPSVYFDLLPPENLVVTLREIVTKYDLEVDVRGAFIKYDLVDPKWSDPNFAYTCYASLFPQTVPNKATKMHRRWIQVPIFSDMVGKRASEELRRNCNNKAIRHSIDLMRESGEPCGILEPNMVTDHDGFGTILIWSGRTSSFTPSFFRGWASRRNKATNRDDYDPFIQNDFFLRHKTTRSSTMEVKEQISPDTLKGWDVGASEHDYRQKRYKRLFGSSKAAIYHSSDEWKEVKFKISLTDIIQALDSHSVRGDRLGKYLLSYNRSPVRDHAVTPAPLYFKSLENLHLASEIYSSLAGSEINMAVLSTALHKANWGLSPNGVPMSRARSFACIVMFETGGLNLQLEDLEEVVAISSGNSLYVSELLLCDPYPLPDSHVVRCLVGNVGKPGLSLILLPKSPIHRERDLDTWELVNHAKFDGVYEDSFKGTSLHLSLTGYDQALNIGKHGSRDKEVYYLEAVIAALDKGNWVTDLGIWCPSLHSERSAPGISVKDDGHYHLPANCSHSLRERTSFALRFNGLTSTDNWYEVFDRPSNASIVRARGNWIARLALATVMMNEKTPMIIGSHEICWACVEELISSAKLDPDKQMILC